MKKNNETKVVCPNCGTEIAICEHEHTVHNATVIGKDSNLGTVVLPPAKKGKADERLEALKKAGVDTSGLFAMQSASGEGMVVRLKDGIPAVVEDDDPVWKAISEAGVIPERSLFRRWVMSQMFNMLTQKHWRSNRTIGFNAALRRKGFEYTLRFLEEELRVQATLIQNDKENYFERLRWFNRGVVLQVLEDYMAQLALYIGKRPVRKCKGVDYKRIKGRDIFVSDIYKKITLPLESIIYSIRTLTDVDAKGLWYLVHSFNKTRVKLVSTTRISPAFIDAYKGSGAYYTMKNLIMFHGCRYHADGDVVYDYEDSMKKLESRAVEYAGSNEGWRMFAMMQKLIADNNIDIDAKRAEWREKKQFK